MACGKSTIGKLLAKELSYNFIDLDTYIETQENKSISEIFETRGEIYFRKQEAIYLKEVIENDNGKTVFSLGGGTPCYGTNLDILKTANAKTVYLNVPVGVLTQRLWDARGDRPLVAGQDTYEALEEYVRKHLFERGFYYNQSQHNIKTNGESPEAIAKAIQEKLF